MLEDIEGLPRVDPDKLKELRERLTVALADHTTVDVHALAASLAWDDVPRQGARLDVREHAVPPLP